MKNYLLSEVSYEQAEIIPIKIYKTYVGFKNGLIEHFKDMLNKSSEPPSNEFKNPKNVNFCFKLHIVEAEEGE